MHLSITIPTYNRYDKLKYQLDCLLSARNDFGGIFNVIVCDNCSTDSTYTIKNHPIFATDKDRYIKNDTNVGLIGNLNRCILEADGDYVWLLGDDDPIVPNELAKATQKLLIETEPDLNIIFLNPSILNSLDEKPTNAKTYIGDKINEGQMVGLEIFKKVFYFSNTLTFWISAFWVRTSVAKQCVNSNTIPSNNLMLPLFLVGYAAKSGNGAYWKFRAVQHRCNEDSWSRTYEKLVLWLDYPEVIQLLLKEGIPLSLFKEYISKTTFSFKTIVSLIVKFPKEYLRILVVHSKWRKLKNTIS
jgi:glycosyltransferase involved in cell wall biosynthesis